MLSRVGVLVVLIGLALGGAVIAYVLGVFGPYDVVYSRGGVEVVYVGKPLLGNDTVLRVQVVDRGERPLNVTVYATGPTLDGFVEVGRARAVGETVMGIGRYVAEARRLVRALGYRPSEAGPSIVLHVTRVVNGTAETDIVTVPLIPGRAVGREIVARIVFRPDIRVHLDKEVPNRETSARPMASPPSRVYDYCVIGVESSTCYYWRYKSTVESGTKPIYIAMTYLDSFDGDRIKFVQHTIDIDIFSQENIYVDLAIGLGTYFSLPGPGFTIFEQTVQSLLSISCNYYNSKLESSSSFCNNNGVTETVDTFYDEAIVGTGFRAQYEVAVYEYVEEDCFAGYCSTTVLDEHELYWVAPISVNDRWDGVWHVDDDPYDGVGLDPLWDDMTSGYTVVDTDIGYGAVVGDSVDNMAYTSGNVVLLPISLPILSYGRFGVGLAIEVGYSYSLAGSYSVVTSAQARPDMCVDIRYRRYSTPDLYVEPARDDTAQDSELVSLELAYYWPYTYSC